jgi:deoxyhypusine synthase
MTNNDPISKSKYMGKARAQIPLRLTPEFMEITKRHIEEIDADSGFQAIQKYHAAKSWTNAIKDNYYVWLGFSGAGSNAGINGLIADAMKLGLIDVMVSTGANVYHDTHTACCLPLRHGSYKVNDNDLRRDKTTRIYNQFIHADYTLKAQDMILQDFSRKVLPRLEQPFSSARFSYEIGKEMLNDDSGTVVDKEGSFLVQAAKNKVPVFLDSQSNHSLGMNLAKLKQEGYQADMSPTEDLIELASLVLKNQPQLNVFLGEGGTKNIIQTIGPMLSETFHIPFKGVDRSTRFTVASDWYGALSGSGQSEAVSWWKYEDDKGEVVVMGDYTTTFPDVIGSVAAYNSREPRGLMDKLDDLTKEFKEEVEKNRGDLEKSQRRLRRMLPSIVANEKKAREETGYKFD